MYQVKPTRRKKIHERKKNASGQRAFRPVHVEGINRDAGELAFEKGILLKAFRGEVFLYKVAAAFRFFDDEHHILLENL